MHRIIVLILTILVFLFGSTVVAKTIYTWTDADGVKRYSNSQPPEDAENVQTMQEIPYDQREDDQSRRQYDRMVEDASKSADQYFEKQADKKAQEKEARRQQHLEAQARRIEKERAKLQKEIDEIQGRGLSRTFSSGQKAYLIKQVQEKINQLESNPDDYFSK